MPGMTRGWLMIAEDRNSNESRDRAAISKERPNSRTLTFNHDGARCRPRTLHRTTHQGVEQETFRGMCASTVGDSDIPRSGGYAGF